MSSDVKQRFGEDGYVVPRQLLSPSKVRAARAAYEQLVIDLASICAAETRDEVLFTSAEDALGYLIHQRPLIACSYFRAPEAVHTLWYRKPEALPSFYLPEAFALATDPAILDMVGDLLETNEISWSPIFYCNIKYSTQSLGLDRGLPLDFLFGPTHIHCDMQVATEESFANQIVNVWVPLTEATSTNGTLCVIPESHKAGPYPFDLFRKYGWQGDETSMTPHDLFATFQKERIRILEHAVALETSPGDAVMLDYSLYHGSWPFERETRAPEMRWALNFRYFKTGTPCGLNGLPTFPVRSARPQTVVPGPGAWGVTMERAIRNQLEAPTEVAARHTEPPDAVADWLRLGRDYRAKARSFVTGADAGIAIRVTADGADVFAGPTAEIAFCAVKASIASHKPSLDLAGRMVDVEITSPVATCSLRARAHVVDDKLVLDLLDLPLEDYPSREQQNRLHQIVSHVGETCALTNPRNIPLVRRTTVR